MDHAFGRFVFMPPTKIAFYDQNEWQWKTLWKEERTQRLDVYL